MRKIRDRKHAMLPVLLTMLLTLGAPERIPITFTLEQDGYVTLVIEQRDADGDWLRTRNLIQDEPFPRGAHTVYWDGYDFGMPQRHHHARYNIIHRPVEPGTYRVRGLVHTGIDVVYEFSVYQPGSPPWAAADPASGWLGEHGPPTAVAFLPDGTKMHRGTPQMMISSEAGEVYQNTAYVDLDGNKLFGRHAGHFIMHRLARDVAPEPFSGYDGYSATDVYQGERGTHLVVYGLIADPRNDNVNEEIARVAIAEPGGHHIGGMAAWDGFVLLGNRLENRIHIFDARERRAVGSMDVEDPGGIAFDDRGRLYVAQGLNTAHSALPPRIVRYDWSREAPFTLRNETLLIADYLEHPHHLIVRDGRLYVADWGFRTSEAHPGRGAHRARHQIRVFDAGTGRHLYDIGEPGGPQMGRYDEHRMHRPMGFDLDNRGRLWVAENDMAPRRISIWHAETGEFIRAIYGNSKYGGGGTFHPRDRTRMFYSTPSNAAESAHRFNETIEFRVDWDRPERSKPHRILWRHASGDAWNYVDGTHFPGMAPELPFVVNGTLYMTNWHQNGGGSEPHMAGIWKYDEMEERLRLVSAVGVIGRENLARWSRLNDPDVYPLWAGRSYHGAKTFFSWSDRNGDSVVDVEELQFRRMHPVHEFHWPHELGTAYIAPNLDYTSGMGFTVPVTFEEDLPVYELDQVRRLALVHPDNRYGGDGPHSVAWMPDRNYAVHFGGPLTGFKIDPDASPGSFMRESMGKMTWAYHVQTPTSSGGIGADHLPRHRGDIHRMMRYVNAPIAVEQGEAGTILAVSAYHGSLHVLTHDGLYVTDLGADSRVHGNWMEAMGAPPWRGRSTQGRGLRGESYFHSLSAVEVDGEQRLILQGGGDTNIFTVKGFGSVRRIELGTIEVTEAHVAGLPPVRLVSVEPAPVPPAQVAVYDHPAPDALPAEGRLTVDPARGVTAHLAVDNRFLHVVWEGVSSDFFNNPGTGPLQEIFSGGGGLDLFLSDSEDLNRGDPTRVPHPVPPRRHLPGDVRLFVTVLNGTPRAVLFQRVAEGAAPGESFRYASPIHPAGITFDAVTDISESVTIDQTEEGVRVRIALSALPVTLRAGKKVLGDVGIVVGNGETAIARSYWHNRSRTSTNDLPTEAEFWIQHMGILSFEPANQVP